MKKIIINLVLCFLPVMAAAQMQVINPLHPIIVTGVFSDMRGHSDGGSALALLTMPQYDFVPLAIGSTIGQGLGGPSVALGMGFNLLPDIKFMGLFFVNCLWPQPEKFSNLKGMLAPPEDGKVDVVMSLGPNYNLVFFDGLRTKGLVTLFYGAKWQF